MSHECFLSCVECSNMNLSFFLIGWSHGGSIGVTNQDWALISSINSLESQNFTHFKDLEEYLV